MKTYFLTGDVDWRKYGCKRVTKKLNNGDWDYWLIIDFINMKDATGEDCPNKYLAQISAVSPKAAGWKNVRRALKPYSAQFLGIPAKYRKKLIIEALVDYGISAMVDSFAGNNASVVMRKARKALPAIAGLFGFFMDGSKNLLGHTGWDFIAGDLGLDNLPDHYTPSMHVDL